MDVKREAEEIFKLKQKERNRANYLQNRAEKLSRQTEYNNQNKERIARYQKMRRLRMKKCEWCDKEFDEPGYIIKYHKKYFCDEKCLGKYLVDKFDDETEAVWVDTPENIKACALEWQAQVKRDAEEYR